MVSNCVDLVNIHCFSNHCKRLLDYYKGKNIQDSLIQEIRDTAYKLLLHSPSVDVYLDFKKVALDWKNTSEALLCKLDKTHPQTVHIHIIEKYKRH